MAACEIKTNSTFGGGQVREASKAEDGRCTFRTGQIQHTVQTFIATGLHAKNRRGSNHWEGTSYYDKESCCIQ